MLALSLLPLLLPALQEPHPATHLTAVKDLVEVRLTGRYEAGYLMTVATDVDDRYGVDERGCARIFADDEEQARLRGLGFKLRVLQEDLSAYFADRAAGSPPLRGVGGSMGGFKTLAEIEAEMDALAANYPTVVSPKFSIGQSVEGRDIWALRISDTPMVDDPSEPLAWFDGLHHAREPMSAEAVLLFADRLASNYGFNGELTRLVNTRNVVIVPCVNPDGYAHNESTNPGGGGLWRKNRRDNGDGSFGVNLDRNYGWEWGAMWTGSSGDTGNDFYRGTAAFSEPETQAVRDALAVHPPTMSASARAFGNLWSYPWGYDAIVNPDNQTFRYYAERMTTGNAWPFGTPWQLLFVANGTATDWQYGTHGTYAFSAEIGGSADSYWPLPARIPDIFQMVSPAFERVAQWSGAWGEPAGETWSIYSADNDPLREPGEIWILEFHYDNHGTAPLAGDMTLSSPHPEVVVETPNRTISVPARGSGTSAPFGIRFTNTAQFGTRYELSLALTYEGHTTTRTVPVFLGKQRLITWDEMSLQDFGWGVSNPADEWSWERGNPQATDSGGIPLQPGIGYPDGSAGDCWVTGRLAGGSAGANDVDGFTILESPEFLASHLSNLRLDYARWFANLAGDPLDDELVVEVSPNSGGIWFPIETVTNANSWQPVSVQLEEIVPLTDRMKLRFTVADDPNNDFTEAALDDVVLTSYHYLPTLGIWGRPNPGGHLKFTVDGVKARSYALEYSRDRFDTGRTVPGFEGLYWLTGDVKRFSTGTLAEDGTAEVVRRIPNNGALVGRTFHFQAIIDEGGNRASISDRMTIEIVP